MAQKPDWTEVVLEEYRSLRTESLAAIDRQHQILALGAATSGVLLGVGARAPVGSTLAAVLLMILMPFLAAFVVFLWLGEFERMVRAGAHIAEIEGRIAERYEAEPSPLTWETVLREGAAARRRVRRLYPVIFVIIIFSLGVTGAAVGFVGLIDKEHWVAGILLASADVLGLIAMTRFYVDTEVRLRVVGGERFTRETLPRPAKLLGVGREALELSKQPRTPNG